MNGFTILITGRNAASAVLDKVGRDVQKAGKATEDAAQSMGKASMAVDQALSGNVVDAARNASGAISGLWKVILAHPFLAIAAAIGAATAALVKYKLAAQQAAAEQSALNSEADADFNKLAKKRSGGQERVAAGMVDAKNAPMLSERIDTMTKREAQAFNDLREKAELLATANKKEQESRKQSYDMAKTKWQEAAATLEIYRDAMDRLSDAAKKENEENRAAAESAAAVKRESVNTALAEIDRQLAAEAEAAERISQEKYRIERELADKEIELARMVAEQKIEIADAAAAVAAGRSQDAMDKFRVASTPAAAQDARDKEREASRDARREMQKFERALRQGEKGVTGKHITAAQDALAAAAVENIAVTNAHNARNQVPADAMGEKLDAIKTEIIGLKEALLLISTPA